MQKQTDDNTDPYIIPDVTSVSSDATPLTTTRKVHPLKKLANHVSVVGRMCSLYNESSILGRAAPYRRPADNQKI